MDNTELNFNEFDDLEDSDDDELFSIGVCSAALIKASKKRAKELEKILSQKRLPPEEREARLEELKLIKSTLSKY